MQYTVVHSTDPYLLARLATDLQMSGVSREKIFDILSPGDWIAIYGKTFYYLNHKGVLDPIRHELTSRNYISVLTKILEP